jgi:hypothetical protein
VPVHRSDLEMSLEAAPHTFLAPAGAFLVYTIFIRSFRWHFPPTPCSNATLITTDAVFVQELAGDKTRNCLVAAARRAKIEDERRAASAADPVPFVAVLSRVAKQP